MKKLLLLISAAFILTGLSAQYSITSYNASCAGLCNGYGTVLPYHSNYQYLWDDGSPYSADSSLCAGQHYCIVRDSVGGYLDSVTCTIMQPTPLAANTFVTNATCQWSNNGQILISVNGGTSPYTFNWSNGATMQNQMGLSAGTYSITLSDANGCTATVSATVTQGSAIVLTTSVIDPFPCGTGKGSGTVTATGGTAPYSYYWSDGDSLQTDTALGSGSYYVIVTDSLGCSADAFVSAYMQIDSNVMNYPTCDYPDTGMIGIYIFGGTAPYSYSWNTGDTTTLIHHLSAGNYSVTVTDSSGCQAVRTFNLFKITADLGYYGYISITPANCSNNGSVTVTPYGGYPPYSYIWSAIPLQTTATATGLAPGAYSVTVTDSLGCIATGTETINYECTTSISGTVFVDTNGNCILDAGESRISGARVEALGNGYIYYGQTDNSGNYSIQVPDTGTYSLTISYLSNYCPTSNPCGAGTLFVTVTALDTLYLNNNFGFISQPATFDLTMHPGWTSANPGFQKEYWIMPFDASTNPYTGTATVVFTYDSNLVYEYSLAPLPAVDLIAHTLTWVTNYIPNPSFDWYNGRFQCFFLVPASLSLGYHLQSDFYITPTTGDCDVSNNDMHFSEIVTGSHDPNEKTVEPAGAILESDSVLTYTIHFQNDGTDTAWFITVKDTLSPNLDPASVRILASSHLYTFSLSGTGILTWVINPANLPDSLVNRDGSKGFITFSVKKKSNLPVGTTISNRASIYFDYNEPVVTNTVSDTLTIQITTRTQQLIAEQIRVNIYPNPANSQLYITVTGGQPSTIFIYDMNGQKLLEEKYQQVIDINRLSAGIYFIEIKADTGIVRRKFVKI